MDVATMKYYYTTGLWTLDRLDKLLAAKKITQEQYAEITAGKDTEGEQA